MRQLERRVRLIERAFAERESERAAVARKWTSERAEARRQAINAFDYQDMVRRQPELAERMRANYARLNGFLEEQGFEPVVNEFTKQH